MISMYWHVPQLDCDIFFSYCLGLVIVTFFFCADVDFFTDVPVQVCGSLVVQFWLAQSILPSFDMVRNFLELTTSFWPMHLFLFPFLLYLFVGMMLCFMFDSSSMDGWSFIFKLWCFRVVELSFEYCSLVSYGVLYR